MPFSIQCSLKSKYTDLISKFIRNEMSLTFFYSVIIIFFSYLKNYFSILFDNTF